MGASEGTYEKVFELLGDIKNKSVLDCGAGKGKISELLKNKGAKVEACDINRKHFVLKDIKFKQTNLNKYFPYESSKFDIVISIEVLEHLENPHHFFKEISRVLKKGGRAIITTPNISNLKSRLQFLFRGSLHWFHDSEFGEKGSNHINPIYFKELVFVLKKNNLKLVKLSTNRNTRYTLYSSKNDWIIKRFIYSIANFSCDIAYRILSLLVHAEDNKLKTADILIIHLKK